MKVGYIGLGAMGGSLARHLLKNHELTVWDLNTKAVADLVAMGAKAASTGAELARACDVVMLCLPRTSNVREVIFSSGGVQQGITKGKLVVDQTSGIPQETAEIARRLEKLGVLMLDAPVSGGIPAAQSGTVSIIASGPDAAWEMAAPVLDAMSSKVFRCSDRIGDGQALKLVNNAMGAGYRMMVLELAALGLKAGLSLGEITQRLNAGDGANFTTKKMLVAKLEGKASTDFSLALMVKDLNEALELGLQTGSPMHVTSAARNIMQVGLNTLGGGARLEDVFRIVGSLAGVDFGRAGADSDVAATTKKDQSSVLASIERAVDACNHMATFECVAMGTKYGLMTEPMDEVLNSGSAWSFASERFLGSISHGKPYRARKTIGGVLDALRHVARLSAKHGVPAIVSNAVLASFENASSEFGDQSDIGVMANGFERAKGTESSI
ncbi:MAG: NAD(P)-dependent oxidoreductase [Mesorhizobium sp.]|uniref:NAD(P)-binding domain-containing protein n=1 Tax=Mesorhizobium sp. TaxID=1871066 RepID=UPI00122268AF|nr:NAD(P)-binding domain-containing protein [Mesorhizobium sp.]TIQ18312.1 MAG: NAD(P)-dependent oxidoreductase [Mesorhizobium sp.]